MKPPVATLQAQYTAMKKSEINNCLTISNAQDKICLLAPYKNNDTEFYNTLYSIPGQHKHFAFFGHDFSGCFFISKKNASIGYMFESDGLTSTAHCNSTINHFIIFHSLFIGLVTRIINAEILDIDAQINALQKIYCETDSNAMAEEENYWPMRLYELSEEFFPLDDTRIKLYDSL